MNSDLRQELGRLKHGDHACLIYENPAEQISTVVQFIIDGLGRGDRCLCIAGDQTIEDVVRALEEAGVDVARERRRDALRLLTNQDTYLRDGGFVLQDMIDLLRRAEAEALADGFSGLRMTGEPTRSPGPGGGGHGGLIEYEACLDQLGSSDSKSVVLCQYHQSRFGVPCIHDVLRTHPVAILGDQVRPNPYYESPGTALITSRPGLTRGSGSSRADWWIAQLERASRAERERESALQKLRENERRFAEAQQIAHIGSWERDLRTNEVNWSDELHRLFGVDRDQGGLSYQRFLDLVSPEDVDRIRALVDEAVRERRPFCCDYRITHPDGGVCVIRDQGGVILDEAGEPIRLVGTAQDVTEQRKAEQALQEYAERLQMLSRRVLEVQEEERRHLARELHDDFGQFLATMNVHLHAARALAGEAALPRLAQCVTLLQQAGDRMRSLARELRPDMLDVLGLEATLRWLAEQHQQSTGCEVQVVGHLSERPLSPGLAITCFRVVQEALTNVVRHASAQRVWIELSESESNLELVVGDDGVGFDVARAQEQAAGRGSLGPLL